ncbi:putative exported peptidase [Sorangium cellulosum So ce56]|uniref:Exported peptidase n=1 Tax=Sorangium cellulosum (strain So ce56) TaxID=448385 RepID=A9FGQ8_SORC5|nr:peptidoglycan DD-metalloendopeptidase family protein [Sorangium cellulosum]CAN98144.1 putative exported peptidase [Sorangium cellulosum So ce56]
MRRRIRLAPLALALLTGAATSGAEVPAPGAPAPTSAWAARAPAPAARPGSALAENDLDRLLAKLDAEEKALRAELDAIGPALELTRRRMIARGRAYYRHVRAGFLPVGGGFDALVDHAARVERTRLALERDLAREAELTRRSAELADRLTHLGAERAPLEVHREAMNRARVALAQEEERRAAFSRAFETSVRPDYLAIYGADTGPAELDRRAGFRALMGRLPFPIAGRAEVRKVSRRGVGGPGVELTALDGAPVRSVAAGRVAFADTYADYGLTVIVDHGERLYSVYANLGAADVRAGDQLQGGARVGTVASGSNGAKLYFELRRGAEVIDPGPWFGM